MRVKALDWRREWDMFRLLVNAETRFGSSRSLMQFELEARADRRAESSTLYCFRRRYAMRPPFRIPLRILRRRRKKKPFGFFRRLRTPKSTPEILFGVFRPVGFARQAFLIFIKKHLINREICAILLLIK